MNHEELREQIAEVVVSPKGTLGEATDAILSRIAEAVEKIEQPKLSVNYSPAHRIHFNQGWLSFRKSILELLEGK